MLLWLDLETTGLDPMKEHVLEVAAVLTRDNLVEVAAFESVIAPEFDLALLIEAVDPYV